MSAFNFSYLSSIPLGLSLLALAQSTELLYSLPVILFFSPALPFLTVFPSLSISSSNSSSNNSPPENNAACSAVLNFVRLQIVLFFIICLTDSDCESSSTCSRALASIACFSPF
jgi:hypothetical protein